MLCVTKKSINKRQLPLYKIKRRLPKILSEEELNVFFNVCDNYMYKTIKSIIFYNNVQVNNIKNIEQV